MAEISVARARTVLARAFTDDPLFVWFFPDDDARPHATATLLGLFAEHYLAGGRVDVAAGADAVAMWREPGAPGPGEGGPEALPTIGGVMAALMGTERAREAGIAMSALVPLRPPEPHAYLHLLAVHPDSWGRGVGGELLDRGLAAARDAGLVACLETMNPANVPFYAAHGLQVRHETELVPGGPVAWTMTTG